MPANKRDHPYTVGFELHELVINISALVLYHSKKISEFAEFSSSGPSDQQQREKAKRYAEVAETLIIKLQDAIDENEIGSYIGSPA
jgi:hypothetical protein